VVRSATVVGCTLLVLLALASSVEAINVLQKMARKRSARQSAPLVTFGKYAQTGILPGDDYFSQVRPLLEAQLADEDTDEEGDKDEGESEDVALLQLGSKAGAGTQKVQSFCEICILVMQMKERGQPHLCAGLNDQYYVTCVEVLISLLRADKALVYWLKNGCMHMDQTGPEIVRPCPAINICSWVPNLFSQPPSIVRDGVESLCPKDNKFLPTIPQEYKSLIPSDEKKD